MKKPKTPDLQDWEAGALMFTKDDDDDAHRAMFDILSGRWSAKTAFERLSDAALMCFATFSIDPLTYPTFGWVIGAAKTEIARRGQPALYWGGPAHKTMKILHPREELVPFHAKLGLRVHHDIPPFAIAADVILYRRHLLAGPEPHRYAVVMVLETDPPPEQWPHAQKTEAWELAQQIGAMKP